MPFFSVIIPLFNKGQYLENTLKSVLNQSFQDFEVIIVNDGSTDNGPEIVSKFDDSRINLINQINKGVSAARNRGILEAKSEFIALLDADDIWYGNHLSELKKQINLFPEAGLYCNNYKVFYQRNISRPAKFNFTFNNECLIIKDFFKASIINPIAWTSAVGFSKEKFNQIGQFDLSLKTAQDLDLWIRLALKYEVSFNPLITMEYKLFVDNSLSKKELNAIRYDFISKFAEEEKAKPSLKLYLDINRYAVALRSKENNDLEIYKKLVTEINKSNLNNKQLFLLKLPVFMLKLMRYFHSLLVKNGIYVTAYK